MKNTKKCPKCQSSDIVKIKGECGPYGGGNNIAISGRTPVLVNRYLCCSCGYSEEWINQEDIIRLARDKKSFNRNSVEFYDEKSTTHPNPMSYIILKITAVMVIAFIISLLLMWLLIYLKR